MDGGSEEAVCPQGTNLHQFSHGSRLKKARTKAKTGLDPKPAQLRFAMALVMGQDVTCVAATGFRKSLAFQMVTFLKEMMFGIVITPIGALGEDQVRACEQFRIKACYLVEGDIDGNSVKMKDMDV
ncbi:hypothetical protein EV426DRAFT_699340 [Tirmania nivea]|nr:hypothetical protein EV426DRAFT_699340 [Tirmania nivea]